MMSQDARQKLRDMGGIMASSPDLIQAVQKFNDGGPIMPMPPRGPSGPNFAPRMPPVPMSGIRPSSLQVPPLAGTLPVVPRELVGDARRRALAGTAPSFGMSTGLGSLEPILEDDISPDDLLSNSLARGAGPTSRRDTRPNSPLYTEGDFASVSGGRGGTRRPVDPNALIQEAESLREEAGQMPPTRGGAGVRDKLLDRANDLEEAANSIVSTPNESPIASEETPSPEEELSPEETIMAQPLVPEEINDETLDRMRKLVESDPNITPPPPGGGDDKPTKRDLRSRYNDQLALMQEIYGLEDKDEAQERAMSLAMIGLAIAAGQSPNALTNIAQGAMVGLQGMGERRDAARERERGIKTLALQTAIDQQAAEAEAAADAAKMDLGQQNKLELEEYKARLGAMYGGAGGSRDARNIIDFTQNTYTEALKAASAMTAPDFDPDTETPHQYAMRQAQQASESMGRMFPGYGGLTSPDAPAAPEIPTITAREEYDALPSGTKFMQNGQERIKP